MTKKRHIGVVVFPGFELLDVFGPLEIFGNANDEFHIHLISEDGNNIRSNQGPKVVADHSFETAGLYDILLVPGGNGTRQEVRNDVLLEWLKLQADQAEIVISVCTGSSLLATAGILDGVRATSNKLAFEWVTSQRSQVVWQAQARWVEDGKFFTSSGVSAGIDLSLAIVQKLLGPEKAEQIANWAEYDWHRDPSWDPFARISGLA